MIKIRKAKLIDVPKLLKLWNGLMNYHQRLDKKAFTLKEGAHKIIRKFFIKNIKEKNSIVLIAEDNSEPIGYLMGFIQKQPPVFEDDKYGYISDGFIEKKYRSKGIMKKMIKQANDFFKNKKLKTLSGRVFFKNKKGFAAWKEMGFKIGDLEVFKKIK